MTRARLLSLSCVIVMLGAVSARAQDDPHAAEPHSTLTAIIRHEWVGSPSDIAAAIDAGLSHQHPAIRELALAAVVSRAGGPGIAPTAPGAADWILDRSDIQKLRGRVLAALEDAEEQVRVQAVAAAASLDFDFNALEVRLSPGTRQRLVRRFYLDPSARVRAKIAAGFGTDRNATGEEVRRLLLDAFDDTAPSVRHAAGSGFDKLDVNLVLPRVLKQLSDSDRHVRAQAAALLGQVGQLTAEQATAIEGAAAREGDPEVRRLMRRAVDASKR